MEDDDNEFAEFFRLGYPKVVASLRHMGFGLEESADSAAEAMILLKVELRTRPRPIAFPLAWVTRVAFRDAARRAKRARTLTEKAKLAAPQESRNVHEEDVDQVAVVTKLLGHLSPGPRQVVALFYLGFEVYEIADILGTKEATVRSHRRHAKKQLEKLVAKRRAEVSGEFDEFLTLLEVRLTAGQGGVRA